MKMKTIFISPHRTVRREMKMKIANEYKKNKTQFPTVVVAERTPIRQARRAVNPIS